jgi:predicted AAA+ superfamily ATPase
METLSLLPLSQSEITGQSTNWLDRVFADQMPQAGSSARTHDLVGRVLRGGYPEALTRSTDRRRTAWARQYLAAMVERDVRDIANIDKLDQLPRFLRALAQTAGQMCNYSQLGGQVGIDSKTASKYVGIFEQMYLLKRVDVWARNRLNRMVKMPKLQFIDSGLLATLLDLTAEEVQKDKSRFGHVLETFVHAELLKHASTADGDYQLMYYRDADKVEVDVVIENAAGQVVGVEIKSSATVKDSDLRGLRKLAGLAGADFKMGVLLYDGDETLPLGNNIWAAPLSTLWGQSSARAKTATLSRDQDFL